MKIIRKVLCILLAFTFVFMCLLLAYAANEDEENPFSGGYSEYRGSDGSVTKVYDNGSVSTEYSDGTKAAIDYNGCRYTKGNDGTQTVYDIDGTVCRRY